MAKLRTVKIELGIPSIGKIEGSWEPDELEERAAWEMYVELITRISIVELEHGDGFLRESLSSLYSLFSTFRSILRQYGPGIARPKGKNFLSLGFISVNILNLVLRPVLSKWHPLLMAHEGNIPKGISPIEHERTWQYYSEMLHVLRDTQQYLRDYADVLAEVAQVPSLIAQPQKRI